MLAAHAPDAEKATRRLLVDLGLALASVFLVVVLSFLAYQHPATSQVAPGLRSLVWVVLASGFFVLGGVSLFFYEEDLGGLPLARWAAALAGVYLFGCALWDVLVPLHIPLFPWGYLVFGWVALAASAWSDSVMLAILGAELLDQVLATRLAQTFGFVGGFASTAVFFHLGVALLEIPLGMALARRYRRALGLGILSNGALTLTWGLLALGTYGPELHNHPEWQWIAHLYLFLAFLVSVFLARAIAQFGEGGAWDLSSRTVIVTLSHICRRLGLEDQLAWLVGVFGYWALAATGIFQPDSGNPTEGIEFTPEMLQDPEQLQALLARLAAADPGRVRFSRERQTSMVRAFLLGALGLYGVAAMVGNANRYLPSPEAFRIEVGSDFVEGSLRVRIDEVHLPTELVAGQAMDCYLLPYEVNVRHLEFTDLFAVPAGSPPPEEIDPSQAWKIRARAYRNRQSSGSIRRGVLLSQRFDYRLPEGWVEGLRPGDTLVFAQGWAGFVFPVRVLPGGTPEPGGILDSDAKPPADPDQGWLGG